jgi:hypothetical protein
MLKRWIINVDEDVKRTGPLYTDGSNVKWDLGTVWKFFKLIHN